jgi:hypothetical protein
VFATATSGRARSASVSPVPFNIARFGARDIPFLIASLCILENSFCGSEIKVRALK